MPSLADRKITFPNRFSIEEKKLAVKHSLLKQTFDFVFALCVTCLILSWLIPLIALIIKLESKGPVLFKQLRTGKDGKPFYCLKFRSMCLNAASDSKQASKNDNRITVVGAFLRKTSLDELPQFINVLRGEMSVVGPRPHMLQHTEQYAQVIHHYMERHQVLPGITGLAQVAGHRGETKELETMAQRVNADMHYLRNWSFQLDVKIVCLTMVQALKGSEKAC
ncbi:exopolysaccharide biosynthesis polyprenyl glycosylphosphotransferase [Hymenobacter psoromatis]|nr:exopolysaccharide biosynthesis polyprenyl glycosylphosphotransferase [Hymenobacter psoromatis]